MIYNCNFPGKLSFASRQRLIRSCLMNLSTLKDSDVLQVDFNFLSHYKKSSLAPEALILHFTLYFGRPRYFLGFIPLSPKVDFQHDFTFQVTRPSDFLMKEFGTDFNSQAVCSASIVDFYYSDILRLIETWKAAHNSKRPDRCKMTVL